MCSCRSKRTENFRQDKHYREKEHPDTENKAIAHACCCASCMINTYYLRIQRSKTQYLKVLGIPQLKPTVSTILLVLNR